MYFSPSCLSSIPTGVSFVGILTRARRPFRCPLVKVCGLLHRRVLDLVDPEASCSTGSDPEGGRAEVASPRQSSLLLRAYLVPFGPGLTRVCGIVLQSVGKLLDDRMYSDVSRLPYVLSSVDCASY